MLHELYLIFKKLLHLYMHNITNNNYGTKD